MTARIKTGGRQKGSLNKSTKEIRYIAGMYAPEAIVVLVDIMRKSDNDSTRLKAVQMLLDRGYGTPTQSSTLVDPKTWIGNTLDVDNLTYMMNDGIDLDKLIE